MKSPKPLLSILTPSLPERVNGMLLPLCAKIDAQIKADSLPGQVEHLVFLDNRCRNVGEKRTALLQMARGEYLAFVDDDDNIEAGYVKHILEAIKHGRSPSVITFKQRAIIEGIEGICEWRLGHPNEQFSAQGFRRPPWHSCAWRTELAQRFDFPPTNDGEDWAWAQQANAAAETEYHIPEILHVYRYDPKVSAATPSVSFLKPRITWQDIPGWFDFPEVYMHAVERAENGASFVEVGTWLAKSTAFMLGAIQASGKSIAFKAYDIFTGSASEPEHIKAVAEYGGSILEAARANMAGACGPDGPSVLVKCDSVAAAQLHPDMSVDFCFIDADHTEAACTRDILAWLPKMKPGGIIAGHDVDSPSVHAAVCKTVHKLYPVKVSGRSWVCYIPESDIGAD